MLSIAIKLAQCLYRHAPHFEFCSDDSNACQKPHGNGRAPFRESPLTNPPLYLFSNSSLDGTTQAHGSPSTTAPTPSNLLTLPSSGQSSTTAIAKCASASAESQIPPPSTAAHANTDPTITGTDSSDSFININWPLAPAPTQAPANDHHSSLAIANAKEVHNFGLEAWEALEQLSTAAAQITNNVRMVQTIDQIISTVSNQFRAQQLCVQCVQQLRVQHNKFKPSTRASPALLNRCNNLFLQLQPPP
uniref:Uncharacterized protein n=1 Tax=Romanomermis culicivorax TaxID=13658 RepID=A0A915IE70_ROMCU